MSKILKLLHLLSPPNAMTNGKSGFELNPKTEPSFKFENSYMNSACFSSASQTFTVLSEDDVIKQPGQEELS